MEMLRWEPDRRAARNLLAAALVGSSLGAIRCGGDGDGTAALAFEDAGEGCNPTPGRFERAIAIGAELHVRVKQGDAVPGVESAATSDPAIVVVREVANPLVVEAVAAGETDLAVEAGGAAGTTGTLPLRVAAVSSSEVAPDELTVPNLDAGLGEPHPGATAALLEAGVSLLPDGLLELDVVLRDAAGEPLIGHGAAGWTAEPAALVVLEPARELSDDLLVRPAAAPAAATEVLVGAAGGGSIALRLLPEGPAASLDVWLPSRGEPGGPVEIDAGAFETIVLLAFDTDGRLLLGNGPGGFTAEVTAGGEFVRLSDPPWAEPRGDIELDEDLQDLLERRRVVYVEGLASGSATLTLGAAGLSLEVPIVVGEGPGP